MLEVKSSRIRVADSSGLKSDILSALRTLNAHANAFGVEKVAAELGVPIQTLKTWLPSKGSSQFVGDRERKCFPSNQNISRVLRYQRNLIKQNIEWIKAQKIVGKIPVKSEAPKPLATRTPLKTKRHDYAAYVKPTLVSSEPKTSEIFCGWPPTATPFKSGNLKNIPTPTYIKLEADDAEFELIPAGEREIDLSSLLD